MPAERRGQRGLSKGPDFVKTTNDAQGVGIGLGNINLTSVDIQPVGTVLASTVFNFSDNALYKGPDSVLYVCDITDANNIYEVIMTNGDDRSGDTGIWEWLTVIPMCTAHGLTTLACV